MIANFTYYTGTYKGTRFATEADFNKAAKRAEQVLKKYINTNASTFTEDEKMCCCSLSDMFDIYSSTNEKNINGVTSESVSGYSVSYSSSGDAYINFKRKIKEEIQLWLGEHITEYRGVGRHVI